MLLFYNLSKFCILKASSIFLSLVVWKLKTKQNKKPPTTKHPKPYQTTQHFILFFKKKKKEKKERKKEHDFLS